MERVRPATFLYADAHRYIHSDGHPDGDAYFDANRAAHIDAAGHSRPEPTIDSRL